MEHLIFTYGTLLLPSVQETVIGRSVPGVPDRLRGFRKTTIRDGQDSFPNLEPQTDGLIDGQVISVSQAELNRIDHYEGDLYVRHRVTLESGTVTWIYYA